MKTITLNQAKQIKFNRASVALGTFDGLHKGHAALIEAAKEHYGDTIAFTFDALPIDVFREKHRPMQLLTLDEKIEAFKNTGIDYLCLSHFDKEFAGIDKDEFESLIVNAFSPKTIIAGYNYTYGRDAAGTAQVLLQDEQKLNCSVEVIPKVIVDGIDVSSTKIRECLWEGDIKTSSILLGYEYFMSGVVVHGRGIGKTLGFPTANLNVPKEKIVPKSGVYSVYAEVNGQTYNAVCSIGVNPTISENAGRTIEVHILDFDRDIYGETVRITFKKRIRDEMRFGSRTQLTEQIQKDVADALEIFATD